MAGFTTVEVQTRGSQDIVDITSEVRKAVRESGVSDGICDLIAGLSRAFPEREDYRHSEGNSHSHLRTSCVGPSQTVIVSDGDLVLGTWQGIFLCEFDGPRRRRVAVKVCEM